MGPSSAPAIQPVVWDIPLPQAPAPDLVSPLTQTLAGLAGPGSFGGPKSSYVEGGLGRIETITADRAFSKKAAEGYFPLTFAICRHRRERTRRHGQRHRDGRHRHHRLAVHDVRPRPQPQRLAGHEGVRAVAAVDGRLTDRCAAPRAAALGAVIVVTALGLSGV